MTRWYCRFRLAQSSNILFLNPFTWIINATLCLVYFLTVCNRIFLIAFLHLIRTLKREIEHKIKKNKNQKIPFFSKTLLFYLINVITALKPFLKIPASTTRLFVINATPLPRKFLIDPPSSFTFPCYIINHFESSIVFIDNIIYHNFQFAIIIM